MHQIHDLHSLFKDFINDFPFPENATHYDHVLINDTKQQMQL